MARYHWYFNTRNFDSSDYSVGCYDIWSRGSAPTLLGMGAVEIHSKRWPFNRLPRLKIF